MKNYKKCKIQTKIGLFSTNDFYCLEHNWIVLIANTVVAHLAVRWLPIFCTPIFSMDLQFLPRLCRRVQEYSSRSRFTCFSMVQNHREREVKKKLWDGYISFFFLAKVSFLVSNDHFLNTFITTFFLSLVLMSDDL